MKKEIIIGVCFTAMVILISPTISAQEYTQVEKAYENAIQEQFQEMERFLFTDEELTDEQIQQRQKIISSLSYLKEMVENSGESTFIVSGIIIHTIISLLFSLIGTIFGVIFGPILSFLVMVLVSPALFLAKIISFILGDNVKISA